MNDYEKKQLTEIEKWKKEEPSVVNQVFGVLMTPVVKVIENLVPQSLIEGALTGSDWIAEKFTDEADILRDGNVSEIKDLRNKNLEISDELANEVHNWAIALAGTEGFAAGNAGLPGMAVDIPTLITFALRTIRKIGLCYGFKPSTKEENMYILQILSAAGSNDMKEKNACLLALRQIEVMVAKVTWKEMTNKAAANKFGQEAMVMALKNVASKLGTNITKRKALQAIPLLGGGIGAVMNVSFINDVAWSARRKFQELWLRENGKIVDSQSV